MAVTIVRAGVAAPNAFGIIIPDNTHAPRYKVGDLVEADTTPPSIGDEVVCETVDGEVAIGELTQATGRHLVLADSCHVKQGPERNITAARYWRIVGTQIGYSRRIERSESGVAA